jgi:hypothetical protein
MRCQDSGNFNMKKSLFLDKNIDGKSHIGSGGITGVWLQGWERERERLWFGAQAAAVENGISILRSRQSQISYSGHQQSKKLCNFDVTLVAEDPTTTR